MKDMYLPSGYWNIRGVLKYGMPFNYVIGGRGTGKTYGALQYCLEEKKKFVFMRRTQAAFDEAVAMNPMASPAGDMGILYTCHLLPRSRFIYGWFPGTLDDGGELKDASDKPFGIGSSLVRIGKTRGLDKETRDVEIMIHDEFVKAPYEARIKNEAEAFFNAYETVNRNRELEGKPPVTAILLSNSDDMVNDYFVEEGVVDVVDKMKQHKENFYINKERKMTISLLSDSPISKRKEQETVLYQHTNGTSFARMAVGNEFVNDVHKPTRSYPLVELRAVVKIGELVIYRHKGKGFYYGCLHLSGTCPTFDIGDTDVKRFQHQYFHLWEEYMEDNFVFESYTAEALFNKFFD